MVNPPIDIKTQNMGVKHNAVALWYLRLNGFLTVQNFVLHPEKGGSAKTDADIVGIRFPHRMEFTPDADDGRFNQHAKVPYFIVAESTVGQCKINGPWKNMESFVDVLRSFGPIPESRIRGIADAWAKKGAYSNDAIDCCLLFFGKEKNRELTERYPLAEQVIWDEICEFFHRRFSTYRKVKSDHESWGRIGNGLWDCWFNSRSNKEECCEKLIASLV